MRAVVANPAPTHVPAGAADQGHEETQRGAKRFIVRHVRFALTLVLVAFILRAIAAIVLHEVSIAEGGNGFFFEDDRGYDRLAWQQVEAWHGVGPDVDLGERYLMNAYVHAEAAVYFVVGHHLLMMKLLNCFLGALTAGLIFLIARRLFGGPAGAFAGIAAAVFPSTFLWSLMSLKDTMFIFAAALLLWLITLLLITGRWLLIIPILAAFALVGGLRTYVQAMFTLLIPATVLLQSKVRLPRKWALSAVLLAGCLALLWVSGGVQWFGVPVDQINRMRYCMVGGANSAYVATSEAAAEACADEEAVPARSLQEIVAWLPTGTWHVIAAPFPWAADTTAERAAMPEMIAWYLAVALAALAIVHHWRDWRDYVHLIGYIGGIAFLLAITQGNLGTLVRHRGMLIPFVLVFSGAGAAWLWSRWRARRSATSVMRLDHLTSRLMNLC